MALDRQSIEKRDVESLASSASEQVRAIIEVAEASATEILRQSENDARKIRAEAAQEAQAARADAIRLARDEVARVSEATAAMLQRLKAMDAELSSLIDGLPTGANRPNAGPQLLEGNSETGHQPEVAADVDGARLVALNMALNGTPRDETDRYLSENFQLDDRMTLLDEVYSSVQG
jgi:hypothetical protein